MITLVMKVRKCYCYMYDNAIVIRITMPLLFAQTYLITLLLLGLRERGSLYP
jgi:hypothetical protein